MKSLLSISDLNKKTVLSLLSLARQIKKTPSKFQTVLKNKKIGLIFEKPSTRTWVSFDAGVSSLGGSTIYLGPQDIKLGVREDVKDVARVLDRYLSGVVLRTFSHETITQFDNYFKRPVINGLSDYEHPCQALADYLTIFEKTKKKKPLLAFVGDGNNVLSSLMLVAAYLGMPLNYVTPKGYEPAKEVLKEVGAISKKTGAAIKGFTDTKKAVTGADFIYTDVWVSMGEEKLRAKKMKAFRGMQVNAQLLKAAKRDVKVMHCLPAHRGEEITDEVLEGKHSIVFDQAENRLHIQKAIMVHLFKGRKA